MIGVVPSQAAPVLLHVCGRYLPLSETFTYDLIGGLDGCSHHVLASSLEHLDVFPLPSVHAPHPESDAWTLARQWGIDAVVCHFGPQCTMGMPLASMLGVPIVTVFHGYDVSRLLRDRLWVERYRACFARGMHALCISDAGRRRLLEIGCPDAQVTVVRLGVDTSRFTYRPPSTRWATGRPVRILMVSRLVPKKGVRIALDALESMTARGLACELRIVGDGPLRDELQAHGARLGLSNVTWLGAVPHAVVQEAFDWADMYVQPSVTADNGDEEGIPVSLMEALASGLPVVSTRHSGIPELIVNERTGLLTDQSDVAGLADALEALAGDQPRAERLAAAGRQWVEQEFNQRRQTARVGRLLSALVERGSRGEASTSRTSRGVGRGLIVQSVDTALLARKLTLLTHRHPELSFDVLSSDPAASALDALPGIGQVVGGLGDGSTGQALPSDVRQQLERARFSLAVVPFADETGLDRQWACDLAFSLRPDRVVGLTLRDREVAPAFTVSS